MSTEQYEQILNEQNKDAILRGEGSDKPLAVYLPGLDGYGISAARNQFDSLAETFDFWRMTVLPEDRSSLIEIVNSITNFVIDLAEERQQKVTLIGESCGGVLATSVAIQLERREKQRDVLEGLVLCNPATSFDQTAWESLVPILTSLPSNDHRILTQQSSHNGHVDPTNPEEDSLTPYAVLGSLILSSLVPDRGQQFRIMNLIMGLPSLAIPPTDFSQVGEIWEATAESFKGMEKRLPPSTLEHRVSKWLGVGTPVVNARLSDIHVPTLVVVGEEDSLMPSAKEAKRLKNALSRAETLVVKERGHFVLDDSVNLTEAILYSDIDPLNWKETKGKYDPIRDWKPPTPEEARETRESTVKPLERVFSPVFFSTDENGKRWKGLAKVPEKNGPILFVANHQAMGADMRFIFATIFDEKGYLPRGLAHPIIFQANNATELFGRTPGLNAAPGLGQGGTGDFQRFGVVKVSPRNYYRLMQTGQAAMLYPGGAREALTADRSYPLFWPRDKTDFVRTAARFNATIVPLSAVGMAESFNTVAKYEQLERLPFVGSRIRNITSNTMGARFDRRNESDFMADLLVPGVPARNYILFGKAIDTSTVDPKDVESCDKVYKTLFGEVRKGIDDLVQAREKDPFLDTPKRVFYEQVFQKQAPTFSIDELNKRR